MSHVSVFAATFSQRLTWLVLLSTCWSTFACGQQDEVEEIVSRVWTKLDGSQVNGKFVARFGSVVRIEKYDGKQESIEIESLDPADQDYLKRVVRKFGASPGARTWSDINGQNFRGSLVGIDGSEIEFALIDEDRRIRIETLFLSSQDIEFILQDLNKSIPRTKNRKRYRVWSYRDAYQNELRMIGMYSGLNQENLVLTQPDFVRSIPLARLNKKDLDYIVNIDGDSRGQIDPIRNSRNPDYVDTKKKDFSSGVPSLSPIWWFSLGLIFLLLLGLISIKYIYESGEPEFDDEL